MAIFEPGDLVHVAAGGTPLEGIVFDAPSQTKLIVAVIDPARGPRFRTVDPSTVTERAQSSSHDGPLKALIRRTPAPSRSVSRGGGGGVSGRDGFTRGAAHRSTGR